MTNETCSMAQFASTPKSSQVTWQNAHRQLQMLDHLEGKNLHGLSPVVSHLTRTSECSFGVTRDALRRRRNRRRVPLS